MKWRVRLFGGLQVSQGDTSVDQFPTKRSGLILARLALTRQGAVGRDELAEALWPEDYLDATRVRLRQELKRLRDALGEAADLVQTDRTWVRLDLDACEVDVREFDHRFRLAKAGENRVPHLRAALDLYTGPLLPEYQEDWVVAARQENRSRVLLARCEVSQELRLTDPRAAVEEALAAVRQDPQYEPAVVALIRAFQSAGDAGSARRAYADYERLLQRDRRTPSDAVRILLDEQEAPITPTDLVVPTPPESRVENLPEFNDSFYGREEEVQTILGVIAPESRTRLATILGPAGVGKTRLAVHAAQLAGSGFERVSFVTADEEPVSGLPRRLEEAAEGRSALVVLDNVESVREQVAAAVTSVLAKHPNAKILATSRQRIGIGAEQVIAVSALATPLAEGIAELERVPSAAMFLDRARQVRPDFRIEPGDAAFFTLLLNRLDGLPLAIELAAARAAVLSVRDLSDQLDERFTWLTTKRLDLPMRQRSLWAAIETSYQALPPEVAKSARCFAVFRGVTVATAEAAIGRDPRADLEELAERSLLIPVHSPAGTRYRMLDSIRDFLLLQTDEAESEDFRRRHAAAMAKALFGPSRDLLGHRIKEAFAELEAEYENGCFALNWAAEHDGELGTELGASLWRFICSRGRPAEGYQMLHKLSLRKDLPDTLRWGECLFGLAATARNSGMLRECREWFERAAELFERHQHMGALGWVLTNDAGLAMETLDYERALARTLAVEEIDRKEGRPYENALNLGEMAFALAGLGRIEEAVDRMERAFALRLRHEAIQEQGKGYGEMAKIYMLAGRVNEARPLLEQAVLQLRECQSNFFLIDALLDLIELQHDEGEPIHELLKELDDLLKPLPGGTSLARRHLLASRIRLSEGRRREAGQAISRAISEALSCGAYEVLVRAFDAALGLTRAEDLRPDVDAVRSRPDPEAMERVANRLLIKLATVV